MALLPETAVLLAFSHSPTLSLERIGPRLAMTIGPLLAAGAHLLPRWCDVVGSSMAVARVEEVV
jgi:hypothetical protein